MRNLVEIDSLDLSHFYYSLETPCNALFQFFASARRFSSLRFRSRTCIICAAASGQNEFD